MSRAHSSLQIGCPAFVEPEMFPRGITNEVATPTVSKLMCYYIYILTILFRREYSQHRLNSNPNGKY